MKFLIAPNAFKGTFTALEAVSLFEEVLIEVYPTANITSQAIADGGDGTCELLSLSLGLSKTHCISLNAIGLPILGFYGWEESTKTAYLDVSTCSGIGVLKVEQWIPGIASTFGTGLLILEALKRGARQVILGLGGSATIDIGAGILQALGFLFLDEHGRELPAFSPDFLKRCRHIQKPMKLPNISFTLLCDVKNHFFGPMGSVRVFGPQKGLKEAELETTESITSAFAELLYRKSKRERLDQAGYGAAGGIALGLNQFFPCKLKFGAPYFFERVGMSEKVANADWIITGEGRYDLQSKEGKACYELLQLANNQGKKIALITSGKEGYTSGFDAILELPPLDFTDPAYKNKAQEQIQGLLMEASLRGLFN
ncbi:MAG: glycerate kinase [Bacteroidetes bacterium]|nr:glycerate kinase [Bacteroidota bacterium]